MFTVRDDISSAGLRRLHLLQAGKEFDIEKVLKKMKIKRDQVKGMMQYMDKDTQMWHLRVYWISDKEKENG